MGRIFETRKATMFARWNRMAKAFTRISKDIVIAVKAGGANPDSNPALRRALQARDGGAPEPFAGFVVIFRDPRALIVQTTYVAHRLAIARVRGPAEPRQCLPVVPNRPLTGCVHDSEIHHGVYASAIRRQPKSREGSVEVAAIV